MGWPLLASGHRLSSNVIAQASKPVSKGRMNDHKKNKEHVKLMLRGHQTKEEQMPLPTDTY